MLDQLSGCLVSRNVWGRWFRYVNFWWFNHFWFSPLIWRGLFIPIRYFVSISVLSFLDLAHFRTFFNKKMFDWENELGWSSKASNLYIVFHLVLNEYEQIFAWISKSIVHLWFFQIDFFIVSRCNRSKLTLSQNLNLSCVLWQFLRLQK